MKKTSLTVSSHFVIPHQEMPVPAIDGKIVSHVFLNGSDVLTCWHDTWTDYLRNMALQHFDRVRIRTTP